MNEEEYKEYDGFHIEEEVLISTPIDEVVVGKDFYEQHDRHAYLRVQDVCPNPACRKPTLEYQIYGNEKDIFCTSCSYHNTIQL